MQDIQCLHHLVHVWFDEESQPKLTQSIKKRIEDISDRAWYVLNFVDEPKYSKEEAEKVQVIHLAETLQCFISFNHLKSMPLWDVMPDDIMWHPQEVIDYLYKLLDWRWQKLRRKSELEIEWKENELRKNPFSEMPDEVKEDIGITDSYYKSVLSEEFLDILLQLIDHFYWSNIYNINYSNDLTDTAARNQERREEIMEYARNLLWDSRIIVSWMNDWDINKVAWLYWDPEKEMKKVNKMMWITLPEIEVWEREHWNAHDYVWDTNTDITRLRYERYKEWFFSTLQEKGFLIQPDITEHVVWWEYINRCVHHYGSMLNMYGIPANRIWVDPSISLVHRNDIKND